MPSIPGTLNFPTSLNDSTSLFEAANRASSNLNGAINNSVTSLTLVSAALFPSSGAISIDDEIIYYTGKSTNTLTGLERGKDGTAAASHSNGVVVRMNPVSAHHEALRGAIIALETKLGIGSGAPTLGNFLVSSANGSSVWGHAIGAQATVNDAAWSDKGAVASILQGADSVSDPTTTSPSRIGGDPSTAFQSTRSGGAQGNGSTIFGFGFTATGKNDIYGLSSVGHFTANLSGVSGAVNQHAGRDYLLGNPTNFGSANVHLYGRWIQAERFVSGIRAVGLQWDVNNSAADAAVDTSSIDTTFCGATNYGAGGHNTGILLSQGAKETSGYFGWRVESNAVCQRILDFTAATATLQGVWAATNGNPTLTGSGGHADKELVAGDIISVNGVNVVVSSATANAITLTANFSGSTGSGLTITKKVQPAWFANNSYLWWQNAAGSARYRGIGLGDGDVWSFDPDGRKSVFWGSVFIGAAAASSLTLAGVTDVLHLQGADATTCLMALDSYGTAALAAIAFRAARGTAASPSAIQSGDIVGSMAARPYGATGFPAGGRAAVSFRASENISDSAQGMNITFETTPIGSTSRAIRWTIDDMGRLTHAGITFANLGTPSNGTIVYCSDGQVTSGADNTVTSGGAGCFAFRINGSWRAFATQN
jgi:hypothetical protein